MFKVLIILATLTFIQKADSIIYRLNVTEYNRMPPIYDAEDFKLCTADPEALFCVLKLELISDEPSPLLDMIREYSEDTLRHFNHSIIERGTCLTKTCKQFYSDKLDLKSILERCFNESLWRDYRLRARVKDGYICEKYKQDSSIDITNADMVVAAVCGVLLLLNIVGSLYDLCADENEECHPCMKVLLCFSIRRSWRKFVSPSVNSDPRLDRLSSLHGVKCILSCLIVMGHSSVSSYIFISNTQYLENVSNLYVPLNDLPVVFAGRVAKAYRYTIDTIISKKLYDNLLYCLYVNGAIIMQIIFVISGFLFVYNMKLIEEKYELRWIVLPKNILLRWLRSSAPYALALAVTMTWQRFASSGPASHVCVMREVKDCQRNWWQHLLYINNYFPGTTCYQQSWSLAADLQFYIVGSIVYFTCRSVRSSILALSLLAVIGVISPAVHIYFQNLDAVPLLTPTHVSSFLIDYPTLDILHRMTHNNIFAYVVGMSLGYLVYYCQQNKFNIQKYKKYRVLYWCIVPAGIYSLFFVKIFYRDVPNSSIWLRILYGSLAKPLFASFTGIFLFGIIFEYERFYRNFLEWRGWVIPARLTFSVYLLHVTFIKIMAGSRTTVISVSFEQMMVHAVFITLASYIVALLLFLFVERPYTEVYMLVKRSLSSDVKTKKL